ncbi:hypothetical protein AAL_04773 [Moelleriella libera RCEF 2490]|uniref:Uncharacterized protein n=1 Tax=Moelleriella libera RCEF 2490 TaxID=1081109 RepID=A0A162IKL4_9HYPO|nr:hypothetical protein AAL_04773 [Moelleriella libera RCEF 2490]
MRFHCALVVAALACLTAATPVAKDDSSSSWAGVLDPWGQFGRKPTSDDDVAAAAAASANSLLLHARTLLLDLEETRATTTPHDLAKRRTVSEFSGRIPGCDAEDDPSRPDGKKPGWEPYRGVKIPKPKGSADEACTTGEGAAKCWHEYFLVEAAVEYADWQPTAAAIACPGGKKDACAVSVTNLTRGCTQTGTTRSDGFDWKIIDASGKVSVGLEGVASGDISIGGGLTKSWNSVNHNITLVCAGEQASMTCSYSNDGASSSSSSSSTEDEDEDEDEDSDNDNDRCHEVWTADRTLHVWGQAQRVCNSCGGPDVKVQQKKDIMGKCVRGQKEFDFRLPINKLVHCNGACGTNRAGVRKPPNDRRKPYVAPENWDLLGLDQQ